MSDPTRPVPSRNPLSPPALMDPGEMAMAMMTPAAIDDVDTTTAVVYCEGNFGAIDGKTANGLVRHSERYRILSVIDSALAGQDAGVALGEKHKAIPICRDLEHALSSAEFVPDSFIFGMAPASGMMSKKERGVVLSAMALGMHVVNGLHEHADAESCRRNPPHRDVRQDEGDWTHHQPREHDRRRGSPGWSSLRSLSLSASARSKRRERAARRDRPRQDSRECARPGPLPRHARGLDYRCYEGDARFSGDRRRLHACRCSLVGGLEDGEHRGASQQQGAGVAHPDSIADDEPGGSSGRVRRLAGKQHAVVLMVELGDLREGIMPADLERMVGETLRRPSITFEGLGANLACRYGVIPDSENMGRLSALADSIEATFGLTIGIFATGRACAREAVRLLGFDSGSLGADSSGVPVWPAGVVGSISHKRDRALAVVARASDYLGLGVDLELDSRRGESRLVRTVGLDGELEGLGALPVASAGSMLLSMKEAVYKCVYPRLPSGLDIGWQDVYVQRRGSEFLGSVSLPEDLKWLRIVPVSVQVKSGWILSELIMASTVVQVTRADFDAMRGELELALREWWEEESADTLPPDCVQRAGGLLNGIPEIDSKAVAKAAPVVEGVIGVTLDPKWIRRGGYGSVDEMVEHLLGRIREACAEEAA
eukprot:Skav231389  [mRNA]  locus=scaffold7522:607:6029:+ [translate_table: standard]